MLFALEFSKHIKYPQQRRRSKNIFPNGQPHVFLSEKTYNMAVEKVWE